MVGIEDKDGETTFVPRERLHLDQDDSHSAQEDWHQGYHDKDAKFEITKDDDGKWHTTVNGEEHTSTGPSSFSRVLLVLHPLVLSRVFLIVLRSK